MTDQTRLEDVLADLIHDWPDLLNLEASSGNVRGDGSDHRIPGGTNGMDLVVEGHTLATMWCMAVLDGRSLTGATVGSATEDRFDFLMTHAEWVADEAPDALLELEELRSRVRGLVAPSGIRRKPIGACPVLDCPGAIHVSLTGAESVEDMPDAICDYDRSHAWTHALYGRLAEMLGTDGPERATSAELVVFIRKHFGRDVNPITVRSWVRRHPISIGWDGTTMDRVSAVMHWLERRAARAGAA